VDAPAADARRGVVLADDQLGGAGEAGGEVECKGHGRHYRANRARQDDSRRNSCARPTPFPPRAPLEQQLEIVRRDRHFEDESARLKMLAVFEMAAFDPELVIDYRGKLSSLLF
jgi:hypothetical protein